MPGCKLIIAPSDIGKVKGSNGCDCIVIFPVSANDSDVIEINALGGNDVIFSENTKAIIYGGDGNDQVPACFIYNMCM